MNNPSTLGVNIDHVATLRQARGTRFPDPVYAAQIAELSGADSITFHLREDRRHIQERDAHLLKEVVNTKLNLEIAITDEMLAFACDFKAEDVCLVPEKREEVTTEGGLDVASQLEPISKSVTELQGKGTEVSLFIDPDEEAIRASHSTGAKAIELHTGAYAESFSQTSERKKELERLSIASNLAHSLGMKVNAGHGLNYTNLTGLLEVPWLEELNIGHSIVARALTVGFERAVREMLELMANPD